MNLLYLIKHFPSLSQTFVLNEVLGLSDRDIDITVVSAIQLNEKVKHLRYIDSKFHDSVIYLKHDYLYSFKPCEEYSNIQILWKYLLSILNPTSFLSWKQKRQLRHLLRSVEDESDLRRRGFLEAIEIWKIICKNKITRIHCPFAEDNVKMAYIIKRVFGIPYSFKMYAYDIFASPRPDLVNLSNSASHVITISQFNQTWLQSKLKIPIGKIHIVRDGINLDEIQATKRYKLRPFRILSVSRITQTKGLIYLLQACSILKQKGLEFECHIYGEGRLFTEIEENIRSLSLEGTVGLKGAIPHESVLKVMKDASVFVLPSVQASNGDMDGTPNTIMEAMASEIPVIATRISGIPEVVEDGKTGILVEPRNAEALAHAINAIYEAPEWLDDRRKAARCAIIENNDLNQSIDQFIHLIQK